VASASQSADRVQTSPSVAELASEPGL